MSETPFFLFAHGWGSSASIWGPMRAALPEAQTAVIERGYFGATPSWPTVPTGYIGVGHSAGTLDLLGDRPAGCIGLIAINGFSRFSQAPDFASGVPMRVLDRMLLRLAADPVGTVTAFRVRCGTDGGFSGAPRPDRLEQGLHALRDRDARAAAADLKLLALAGRLDPIVSPTMTVASFDRSTILWNEAAGHLLPLTHPDWCAGQLMKFARA
ncbi:alpha/beta hydrolase [Lichenicola cladoniae]|uniref:Alpha/beta hydrolase n=1 Tax=Lichenicola cladoniae TaxID=1484109 RepID=A0A6M8HPS7_9PROT|nr:alpha/beta hydrolase [Lichenicola cladoniae]NPD66517.1 alpha/beta hydrolase [Acetobacteraceae bacterium]QKE90265.1 alpha/beta hydrolase [Lichenicola cladoniae]